MLNSKDDYSQEEYTASLQRINENIEEIKQHLLDDRMVVKKGTDRLTVKVYPKVYPKRAKLLEMSNIT